MISAADSVLVFQMMFVEKTSHMVGKQSVFLIGFKANSVGGRDNQMI